MNRFVVVLLALSGCCFSGPPQRAAPVEPTTGFRRAWAQRVGDNLESCLDMVGEQPIDAVEMPEFLIEIPRSCATTFPRDVLSSCTRTGPGMRATQHYYQFSTALGNDAHMLACMAEGGTWSALEAGSPEWRAARRADALGNLQRAVAR